MEAFKKGEALAERPAGTRMQFGREEVEGTVIVWCTTHKQSVAGVWRVNRNYVGLYQRPSNYGPPAKSSPLPVF